MSKIIRNTHISGEAGVLKFAEYCNRHVSYIIFREVVKNDFGVDGEIELTRINEERKTEPLGEIMKVQIKTVASDNSYIRNEMPNSFEFYPRKEDIEYWEKYKNNGLEVLLVIYDQRIDALYCKRVIDTDLYIAKQNLKTTRKKVSSAIAFHKQDNLLEIGKNDFTIKFSSSFKSRVAFGTKENLQLNFLKYKQYPRLMYMYECKYKNKKAVYEIIEDYEAPIFVLYNSVLYSSVELGGYYASFKSKVLTDTQAKLINYSDILNDKALRNHYIELLNAYLKSFLKTKKLAFQKDYRRFYFWLPKDQESVKITTTTRKRGQLSTKEVVRKYTYGSRTFFRHLALECKHTFIAKEPVLLLQPKYYFTSDGKTALSPKEITKLTNYLTARECNNNYCDWLHFWWSYLSYGSELVLYADPAYQDVKTVQPRSFYTKHLRIALAEYSVMTVDFGIASDKKERKKDIQPISGSSQNLLFHDES